MSLGSPKTVEKKKFVPNFNVARVKRETDEPKEKKEGGAGSGKQRKKQDSRKDKKEKKERPELIQTMGSVFSEVIYASQLSHYSSLKFQGCRTRQRNPKAIRWGWW